MNCPDGLMCFNPGFLGQASSLIVLACIGIGWVLGKVL